MEPSRKKTLIIRVLGIFIVVTLLGVTYAFFNYTRIGPANMVKTGRIYFTHEQGNTINLTNAFPISSNEALTDTTNAKTVQIIVTGDTDYSDGIEYLITASDVHMETTTGKTVPITLEVSVAGRNSKTIGTEETGNYYTNRNSYTTSKYKIEYDGELREESHILVGWIAPNTTSGTAEGIDGIISIKAYFNENDILVSDTYNNGNTPTDNLGTPASLGEGKTVLTTSEWNSLKGNNALSFSIKVESREGIWVVPIISTCPGCKFIHTTNKYYWGGANNASSTTIANITDTITNDYRTLNKGYFLGFTESNGKIDRAFACGIKGETPNSQTAFCIEGTSDGSKYSDNVALITGSTLWNDADFTANRCRDNVSDVSCYGLVGTTTSLDGYVNVGAGGNYCYVHSLGELQCTE